MNNTLKIGLLAASIGMAFSASTVTAAIADHTFISNAINYCQAFTPGPSNTIRNRVVGAENIGTPIAVACNFHTLTNGAAGVTPPTSVEMWFANNGTTPLTVTCTMLTGYQGQGGATQYASTKTTASIAPDGVDQGFVAWAAADNPTAGATSLGNLLIGINCTLPTNAVMNDTYFVFRQNNGV